MKNLEHHPFEPIIFPDSKILILGSFPSLKSFEDAFYYAHPRNQFWQLLEKVFNEKAPTKEKKIALCKKHHIALYDSAKSLKRDSGNSSDSNLKEIIPYDFKAFLLNYPMIEYILFTGKKAEQIFNKANKGFKIKKILLPSPSPAYASMSFEQKLEKYTEIFNTIGAV